MAVCYFDRDFSHKYDCSYTLTEQCIEVNIDYSVHEEIPSVNGVRMIGNNDIRERDILIIDAHSKRNFLLVSAYYLGMTHILGTPDSSTRSKFCAHLFYEHNEFNALANLPATPKASRIKVFSKTFTDVIGFPRLKIQRSDAELVYTLSYTDNASHLMLDQNYIKQITLSDSWSTGRSDRNRIVIDFTGYVELELQKAFKHDDIAEFINELYLYMQLYYPDKFVIDKIQVMIGNEYFTLNKPSIKLPAKIKTLETTVKVDFLSFLQNCYTAIPYRKGAPSVRNIPNIVLRTERDLADNFLMFYRFIECYYKSTTPGEGKFITQSYHDHYIVEDSLTETEIENFCQEIVCLRNHYAHAGYYLKNDCLRVTFDKKGPTDRDYTVQHIDAEWIYKHTVVLYRIVIDIIYKSMLGYDTYCYKKLF